MRAIILLVLMVVSVAVGQSPAPAHTPGTPDNDYHAGYAAADSDIKRSVVRYIAIGGPLTPDWPEVVRQAKSVYKVDVVSTGCVATPYERGYSESVIHYLNQKYGQEPILALHKELAMRGEG